MRILVIGSGGREHALCWAIAASPLCDRLYAAPGNPGIAEVASCVPIGAMISTASSPSRAPSASISRWWDRRYRWWPASPTGSKPRGLRVSGRARKRRRSRAPKGFTKDLCAKYGIPTAAYRRFTDAAAAKEYVRARGAPIVVKADGLSAGKGVTVAASIEEALAAIDAAMVGNRFGPAGAEIVIEEFLEGEEASIFALVDGRHALLLASAQDHKRVGDGDTGPNTGGMGAYSPAACVTPEIEAAIRCRIIEPTVAAMAREGRPFKGVLYAGVMLTADGPKLIEYNVRFGDPGMSGAAAAGSRATCCRP